MCCPDLCAANDAISTKYWMKNAFNIALQMQLLNGAFNLILKLKLSDFRQRNHFHRIDFTSALKSWYYDEPQYSDFRDFEDLQSILHLM